MENEINLPGAVPVMPLPGAVLFPHALLPLYIFESRYREMLALALRRDRVFCVSLIGPADGDWKTAHDFSAVATVGLIRACVGRDDGTSNLILQGLERVRFTGFEQEHPFPIARIKRLASEPVPAPKTDALGAKVLELYLKFKGAGRKLPDKLDEYLSDLSDPSMLADLMASTFVMDPQRRQHVLEELAVDKRLRLLIQYLNEESGRAAA